MSIVQNRKASHDYFIEERYEAGLVLEGWEVKAIRAGRATIGEAYVMVRGEEIFLVGANISPLPSASTHYVQDPRRNRKLLLRGEEIKRLIGKVEQRGYTMVPLDLHYTKGRIKISIALARGKLEHDKRADKKDKEWARERQRLLRSR
ncbi:MAG: SsrA-binding protein [Betaproteobacteria bacterium]|jgi:SsrA-binding protein|nr:SsrA-binding protein [Betaproteobacteria bacterium]